MLLMAEPGLWELTDLSEDNMENLILTVSNAPIIQDSKNAIEVELTEHQTAEEILEITVVEEVKPEDK